MSFLWPILIALLFVSGTAGLVVFVLRQKSVASSIIKRNVKSSEEEVSKKRELLTEFAQLTLGFEHSDIHEKRKKEAIQLEETMRAERGRYTISEAELEAVDRRLRDLEELKRELEVSNLEAGKELELLRLQEKEVRDKTDKLRGQLDAVNEKFESLLKELEHSQEAVSRLNMAKSQLSESLKKTDFYETQISMLNKKYMDLKRAYDALDIEYAQLYERQQGNG